MLKHSAFTAVLVLAMLAVLSPWLVNGAPYIGDSWTHLKKVEDIIALGRMRFEEYNDMWPSINVLIALYSMVSGIVPLASTQIVPFLVALSSINLYILLSRLSKKTGAVFSVPAALAFTPLYTFITFGSAVMKETAAFFLATLAITYVTSPRPRFLCLIILALGLVLSHHFATLFAFIFYIVMLVEDLSLTLNNRDSADLKKSLTAVLISGALALSWNSLVIYRIGWFLPISGGFLLMVVFILLAVYTISRVGVVSTSLFQAFIIPLSALAWRGQLHDIPTPVNTISVWEIRDLVVFIVPALIGLALFWRNKIIRSLLVSTNTLVVFSLTSDLGYNGLVTFTKSLHYYALFLSLIFCLSLSFVSSKKLGKIVSSIIVVFLIFASTTGIGLAINGPGAYHYVEYVELKLVKDRLYVPVVTDVKLGYISDYLNIRYSLFSRLKGNEYVLLTRSDFTHGILLGYVWVELSLFMPPNVMVSSDRLFDGEFIKMLRVNYV
jgi:hypothetical protein